MSPVRTHHTAGIASLGDYTDYSDPGKERAEESKTQKHKDKELTSKPDEDK